MLSHPAPLREKSLHVFFFCSSIHRQKKTVRFYPSTFANAMLMLTSGGSPLITAE